MPTFLQTLQAFNTRQKKPDTYIFMYHRLTDVSLVFLLGKKGLHRKFARVLYRYIKFAFLVTVSVWIPYWTYLILPAHMRENYKSV